MEPDEFKAFKAKLDSILGNPSLGSSHEEARKLLNNHIINADAPKQVPGSIGNQGASVVVGPIGVVGQQAPAVQGVRSVQIGANILA